MSRVNRWIFVTLAAVWFVALAPSAVVAQSVIRGPYLQMGTPTSVVVRWRTDVATDSRVSYGSAPDSLTAAVDDTTSKTEHEVTLSLLSPDTLYYYAVGTTTGILAGNDASHFFLTAPNPGTPKPTRLWALGDSGTADAGARAVRDAYFVFAGTRHTDLWLMLGDNAYSDGTDSQYQAAVFNMYPEMLRKSVLWPTLGNHDGHSADSGTQTGPYYDIFTLPRNAEAGGVASGTEAYYSFDYGNMHFIVLDSFDSDRSPGGAMMTWLKADLAATRQDWIIAFWHHPPYSKGSHNSDTEVELVQMRQNALPILEQGGVDLVLAGHSHSYERSFLIDGHYGTSDTLVPSMILNSGDGRCVGEQPPCSPTGDGAYQKPQGLASNQGAVYTVAGSSGHTSGGSLNHPVMFISLNVLGSLVLDVAGNRVDATFLDSTGSVRDTFTIQKGVAGNTPPVAVDDAAATNEDTSVAINVLGNDSDPDSDALSVASVTQPGNGVVTVNADHTVTYRPTTNFNGTNSFTYTASDGRGGKSSATVNVTVTPVNDLPSFTKGPDKTVVKDAGPQTVVGWATNISPGPTADEAGQVVNFIVNSTNTALFSDPPAVASNGTLTYTTAPNATGSATVSVQAHDNGGTANGGVDSSAPQTFTITVTSTVNPPGPIATVEIRVASGSDDAEERSSGRMSLTSSDLELVYDRGIQKVGMRFNGVGIPQGATIVKAYVQFKVDEVNSEATSLTIQAHKVAQPLPLTTTYGNISARPRTLAAVSRAPVPWTAVGVAGPDQPTPEIAPVIQEIVNQAGWSSGNALALIITGTGHRTAESYNGDRSGAPLLHIEYR